MFPKRRQLILLVLLLAAGPIIARSQSPVPTPVVKSSARFFDQTAGMTADAAVASALQNNGDLLAIGKEVDSARAMVRQAGLRPNPKVSVSGANQLSGPDNNQMAEFMLPLELGGRRSARIAVAQRELEVREFAFANQERLLAAEVRVRFGETLAAIAKLDVAESTLSAALGAYELVAARVSEGKIAPLEQNVFLVEVNRLRSIRETSEAKADFAMLELKNLIGLKPEDPLRIRGNFIGLIGPVPTVTDLTAAALRDRPDLNGARAVERASTARIDEARAKGRIDADIKAGYQRMNSGFMLSGYDDRGVLRPINDVFHFFTFGVELDLPVRNRNQGAIAAATSDREAARRRVEFGELTIRKEVAVSQVRYDRAARSLSIFENGVRDQANANLRVIWQTYELGARSLLDYIAEERRYLDVENELIDIRLEAYVAGIEILKATNSPDLKKK